MTSLCLLMIREVKNIYLFNAYLLILRLVISSFTLKKQQKVHKVSDFSQFLWFQKYAWSSLDRSTLDTQYQVVQTWSKSFQEEG